MCTCAWLSRVLISRLLVSSRHTYVNKYIHTCIYTYIHTHLQALCGTHIGAASQAAGALWSLCIDSDEAFKSSIASAHTVRTLIK